MKKVRKPMTSRRGLSNSLLTWVLVLWCLIMGLLTWAVASDFLQQMEEHTRNYALLQEGRLSAPGMTIWDDEMQRFVVKEDIQPEELVQSTILGLRVPYSYLEAEPLLPLLYEPSKEIPPEPEAWWEISWKYLYGFEVAACYRDEERGTCIESRDYFDLSSVEADGIRYETLADYLDARIERKEVHYFGDASGGHKTLFYYQVRHKDEAGWYDFAIAVRCWPMTYTLIRMIPIYAISLAGLLLIWWLLRKSFHSSLLYPLEHLAWSVERGIDVEPGTADWQEPYVLTPYVTALRREAAASSAELRQTETALAYAQNAEEYRKQLISNITHELKTPLAVIHSYAESLQEGIAEEKKDHYLDVILSESERMDGMVLQMLDLSRLEAGKVKLTMDPFSLVQMVRSVTDKFAPLLSQKQLELSYNAAEEFLITADEGRMEQVVTNLISNAYRYTEQGGKIRIRVEAFNRQAQLVVENTAPPLSEEALEKIWESFYRADASRTGRGTGLGLTLVKQIVELHGGSCRVENVRYRSKGNTAGSSREESPNWVSFRITIPLG